MKKTTHRMGDNIGRWYNPQGINLQNIQTAHAVQYKKQKTNKQKKQLKKWAKYLNRHFSKEDITHGQKAYERIRNTAKY